MHTPTDIPSSDQVSNTPGVVSDYEKAMYYKGIGGDPPVLIYRSNYAVPFPTPQGRFGYIPSKSVREVYGTSLNPVWSTVGPQIRQIIKSIGILPFSVDPARFASPRSEANRIEVLGPPVVWVGIPPNSVSPGAAHAASQQILALLAANGAKDVVVEWREAVLSQLAGPALMPIAGSHNPTAHVRRPFTCALNIPLAAKDMEEHEDESQGSLTLYFHENKDASGQPSTAVLAVSCSHILRVNNEVDYVLRKPGARRHLIRGISGRRFQKVLRDIKSRADSHTVYADLYIRNISRLEAISGRNKEQEGELKSCRAKLETAQKAITALGGFCDEVKLGWSDIDDRNIGFVRTAKAVAASVEDGTYYTEDWGAFELDEAKFKPNFRGTVVDLGIEMSFAQVNNMFYPQSNAGMAFEYPIDDQMYEINGVAQPELLAHPDMLDDKGRPCLIVGKDGSSTGLTFGRYAGLASYLCDARGGESTELGIYNWGMYASNFAAKGDSGALVWDGQHRAVGQLHSGMSTGGSSDHHIAYATPAWWLVERIKREFPDAVFFHKSWSL